MARHPHRLMLHQKKTWRCMLPGCRYFIHVGLAYTLPGQQSICWNCGEEFMLDEDALKDEQPKCNDCRAQESGLPSAADLGSYVERQLALSRAGVKSEKELTPLQRNTMKALGVPLKDEPEDEVEVIEPDHASDCSSWSGGECDCK